MTSFKDLGLAEPLIFALEAEGYTNPTPIQEQAIPQLLEGHDVLGIAQTGTGKTAAFALPILHRIAGDKRRAAPRTVRHLILTPTRELAVQINDGFATYGRNLRFRRACVFGGVGQGPQVRALNGGVDVMVATPGRLIDLMDQGFVNLSAVESLVLDEADRMLDMGFIHPVRKIAALLPSGRQTLLFSATMPKAVADLASFLLRDPVRVEVTPVSSTAERIAQKVLFVSREDKRNLLRDLLRGKDVERAIVFTRTKHGANRVAEQLAKDGIPADAIHGNKSQNARQRALDAFRSGEVRALVATDIAARGIDIDNVTHVVNFELPNEPESYVHRIGRTARAGAEGIAVSFCDAEEVAYLRQIEKTIQQPVPQDIEHGYHAEPVARLFASGKGSPPKRKPSGGRPFVGGSRPQGAGNGAARPQGAAGAGGNRPKGAGGGGLQRSAAAGNGGGGNGGQRRHGAGPGGHGHSKRG
ncbi:DEAD/DEAH box helicase [Magnetospirillum sp. 64-120]|uniref:DEAD/DEAH box helicase n=1 Tax=Magnetospirillum sp. 64-120 TaxID=1895778 RepID=UPI00092702FF|nr:DEAD/DEAH box helicase [Magnetospirillum sp. 64-120]OJX70548.1 MAG: DEAD/DEAH box helicase [Magnetospirillum sp. 64-120]